MLKFRRMNAANCNNKLAAGDKLSRMLSVASIDTASEKERPKLAPLDLKNQAIYKEIYTSELDCFIRLLAKEYQSKQLDELNLPKPISSRSLCEYVIKRIPD